jgi:chromosome segregation ATPase
MTQAAYFPKEQQMPEAQEKPSQRADLEARISELEQMNGAPVQLVREAQQAIESRRIEIAGLEAQIAALDAETGATVKRQREEAERARLSERDRMRTELLGLHDERLAALRDAESGIRQTVSAITKLLDLNKQIGRLALGLGATKQSLGAALAEADFLRRLGGRIAAHMVQIPTQDRSRFGGIQWPAERSFYKINEDWAEAEERRLAPHLEPLLKSEKD